MNYFRIASIFLFSFVSFSVSAQSIIRGPYMQTQTSDGIIIKWRTDLATSSKVWLGPSPSNLTIEQSTSGSITDHTMLISGLNPYTKYYYAVGNVNGTIVGADSSHYFFTSPLPYEEKEIRVWITGDFGKGNQCQIDVKQSFVTYTKSQNIDPDLWLWLGDNAYDNGKDNEYQSKVFALPGYSDVFSWLPFYPTPGNHDYGEVWSQNGILGIPYTLTSIGDHDGPYYDMVDVPEQAEAGGFPSTNEIFYSYDYGNTHLLSLNSEVFAVGSSNVLNQMKDWIHDDLTQNDKDWTIAYWHQPPYTKGSHDSDDFYELVMTMMREEIVPILESYDIDMIICGHSHVYERSYLMHGHYGLSNSLATSMILDNSNGNRAQGNAYVKDPSSAVSQGTVYAVAGNSGSSHDTIFGSHPVMANSYTGSGNCGSLVLDIYKNEIRGRHLTIQGTIVDDFSIVKQNMQINAGNDTFICEHDSLTLQANVFKGSDTLLYSWMPGNLIGPSVRVSPNTNTTYTLTVSDLVSGQIELATKQVDVSNIPQSVVISENNGILSVPSGYLYTWYRDGNLISVTSDSYTPTAQGIYQVLVSNAQGCQVFSAVYNFYDLEIQVVADKNEICAGDSIILFLSVSGGSDSIDVQWVNVNGGSSSFYYTPTTTENLIAEGNDFITGEYETDTLEVIVHDLPSPALITQNGASLETDFYQNWNYQWYRDNVPMSGSNAAQITPSQSGMYIVLVTDENGCKSISVSYAYQLTGIRDGLPSDDLLIVPNPNKGTFTLKTNEEILGVYVYNYKGKLVHQNEDGSSNVKLENMSPGGYTLELHTKNRTYSRQFIIE